MTLSAPKPAYQYPEPEPSEAEQPEPESSWPASPADEPETDSDQAHELPCHADTGPSDPEQQRMESIQASFHEQLAELVRALGSEDEPIPESGDDDARAGPERADEAEADPADTSAAEDVSWDSGPGLISLASLRDVLNGRTRGFMVGLGASVAAGGIMLVLASGNGDSPAIAGIGAQSEPQIIAASGANGIAEPPLRASILDETERSSATLSGESGVGSTDSDIGNGKAAADFAAAFAGTSIEPIADPEPANGPAAGIQPAPKSAEAIAESTEPERGDKLRDEPSVEVAMSFETTIQSAPEDQAEAEDIGPSTQSLASTSQLGQTAHVVKHVNLRAGPDNAEAVLAIIPEGSTVEVVQCEQWCEVISEGQRGWVYKDLIIGAIGG